MSVSIHIIDNNWGCSSPLLKEAIKMNVLLDILDMLEKNDPSKDPEVQRELQEMKKEFNKILELADKKAPTSDIMDAMMS